MTSDLTFASLALFVSLAAAPDISIEAGTLSPVSPETKGVNLIRNQRIVAEGKIILVSRTVQPDSGAGGRVAGGWSWRALFVCGRITLLRRQLTRDSAGGLTQGCQ